MALATCTDFGWFLRLSAWAAIDTRDSEDAVPGAGAQAHSSAVLIRGAPDGSSSHQVPTSGTRISALQLTAAVREAEVLFVGGGNSFRLLRAFRCLELVDLVRERAWGRSAAVLGSIAGSNLASPTIRTTNDMPIVEPAGLTALGLIPFQLNPHYADPAPDSTHMGETREQRLLQFLEDNDVPVLGLPEGSLLRLQGPTLALGGNVNARLFRRGSAPAKCKPGRDLSARLATQPQFDQAA